MCLRSTCIRRVENSENLDQLASEKPADLDLHCFQRHGLVIVILLFFLLLVVVVVVVVVAAAVVVVLLS